MEPSCYVPNCEVCAFKESCRNCTIKPNWPPFDIGTSNIAYDAFPVYRTNTEWVVE